MTDEMLKWIDAADYEALLTKIRFSPVGDKFFDGKAAVNYYGAALKRRAKEIGIVKASAIDARIGWPVVGENDNERN